MRGGTLSRLATVIAGSWLVTGALTTGACSSETLRDQNYGTDLAQGYRYPDGGYPAPDSGRRREAGPDAEAEDALDAADALDAGDAPDAGDMAPAAQNGGDGGGDVLDAAGSGG
jgi:hypothetical protein